MTLERIHTAIAPSEDCRWCKRPSKEGHPAGVLPGRWRCTVCRGWQDDEYAPDQLHIAEED